MLEEIASLEARQQPNWPDPEEANRVLDVIRSRDTLVTPQFTDALTVEIGRVANGEAFMLQAGDCAESFSNGHANTLAFLKAMLSMNMVISYSVGLPVVKVGRIAGQFAKPRTADTEEVNGVILPSFRGEIVNGSEPTIETRTPNPNRMLEAYDHSMKTLHTLRSMTQVGGFADLDRMLEWNIEFGARRYEKKYTNLTDNIARAIRFMRSSGVTDEDLRDIHGASVYTSHEGLILDYEKALTHETPSGLYAGSAHMLWIGERTRSIDEKHVAFFAGIRNPIGVKIGRTTTREEILALCETLNPNRTPGRLTLITRMGADAIRDTLPPLVEAVKEESHVVAWVDDPMHGNTITAAGGRKTRHFDAIHDDINGFFDVHESMGTWPGGVHLELTGDNVTECLGGSGPTKVSDLELRYETSCDPRLNGTQGIELAYAMVPRLEKLRKQHQPAINT